MKIAYFDCSSGISGDMLLGAFIDAGLSVFSLEKELRKLKIKNWKFEVKNVERKNLPAKQVIIKGEKKFSSPQEMGNIIKQSRLAKKTKERAFHIFSSLLRAERKVHKRDTHLKGRNSAFHLNELAHLDTLVDIVGSCVAIENFKLDKVYASAINVGSAAPVTLELLQGLLIYTEKTGEELTTPTGAAIISQIVRDFGPMPLMKIKNYGFGAGSKDLLNQANLLRLIIGESTFLTGSSYEDDQVILLETNIDDMNPQIYPYVMEKLFKKGVLDVWLTAVQMKKGRPGIVLSCLVNPEKREEVIDLLFRETTTLGIRMLPWERVKLNRKIKKNSSGLVYKVAQGKNLRKEKVEYNKAVRFAQKLAVPLKDILR